jgi:hypothetical protein
MKKGRVNYIDKMFEKDIITKDEHVNYVRQIMGNEPVNIVEIYHDRKERDVNNFEFNPHTFQDNVNYANNNIFNKRRSTKFSQNGIIGFNFRSFGKYTKVNDW